MTTNRFLMTSLIFLAKECFRITN